VSLIPFFYKYSDTLSTSNRHYFRYSSFISCRLSFWVIFWDYLVPSCQLYQNFWARSISLGCLLKMRNFKLVLGHYYFSIEPIVLLLEATSPAIELDLYANTAQSASWHIDSWTQASKTRSNAKGFFYLQVHLPPIIWDPRYKGQVVNRLEYYWPWNLRCNLRIRSDSASLKLQLLPINELNMNWSTFFLEQIGVYVVFRLYRPVAAWLVFVVSSAKFQRRIIVMTGIALLVFIWRHKQILNILRHEVRLLVGIGRLKRQRRSIEILRLLMLIVWVVVSLQRGLADQLAVVVYKLVLLFIDGVKVHSLSIFVIHVKTACVKLEQLPS